MARNIQDSGFEDYRRERKKHRLNSGPRRDLGKNARVLQELEAAEINEARNQQLTREVHDFFSNATRTAAGIVQKVSADQVHQIEDQLHEEMAEFLATTIRRAQEFVSLIQITTNSNVAETEVHANMQNLVGETLDQFRAEGTAQLSDKHLGLDPFAQELELQAKGGPELEEDLPQSEELLELEDVEPMIDTVPELSPQSSASPLPEAADLPAASKPSMDEHLAADEGPGSAPAAGSLDWFMRMKDEPEKLKTSLKVLVRTGMMSKDEALAVYRQVLSS